MTSLAIAGWLACALSLAIAHHARRGLQAARRAQRHACHELRGALSAALLGLELEAREGRLSTRRRRAVELELGRAVSAVSDLLEPAEVAPQRAEVDIAVLLADSVEAARPAADLRGGELTVTWTGPPARVLGERGGLTRAIDNLIANAIEHGGGRVQVRGWAKGGRVGIEVRDSGAGLRAPIAELVRCSRPDEPRGHGLAIACEVAAGHRGRVVARPSEVGARIVLELPALPLVVAGRAAG